MFVCTGAFLTRLEVVNGSIQRRGNGGALRPVLNLGVNQRVLVWRVRWKAREHTWERLAPA